MSTVISVRVKKELKKEAEKLGINLRKVFEEALKDAIRREKMRQLKESIEIILEFLKDVPDDEWVRIIKEGRRSR